MNKSNYKKIANIIMANIVCANCTYTHAESDNSSLDIKNNVNEEKKLNLKETFLNYCKIPVSFILGSGFTLASQKIFSKLNNNKIDVNTNENFNNKDVKNELFGDTELDKKINNSFGKYIECVVMKLENNIKPSEINCDDASEENILAKKIIDYLSKIQESNHENLYENMIKNISSKKLWSERLLTFADYIPEEKNPYVKFLCNLIIKSGAFKNEFSTNKPKIISVVKLNNTQIITPNNIVSDPILPTPVEPPNLNLQMKPPPPIKLDKSMAPPPPPPINLDKSMAPLPPPLPGTNTIIKQEPEKIEINTVEQAQEDVLSKLSPNCDKQAIINKCSEYSTRFFSENSEININKIEEIFEKSGQKLNINNNITSIFENIKLSDRHNKYSDFNININISDSLFKYWPVFCNTDKENYNNFKLACENLCSAYDKYIGENVQEKSKQVNLFGSLNSNKLTMTIKNDTGNLAKARENFSEQLENIIKCGLNCYVKKTSSIQEKTKKHIVKKSWYEGNTEYNWVAEILKNKSKNRFYSDNSLKFLKNIKIKLENIEKLEDKIKSYTNRIEKYNDLSKKSKIKLSKEDKEFIEIYKQHEQEIITNSHKIKELLDKFNNDHVVKKIKSFDLKDQVNLKKLLPDVATNRKTLSDYLKFIILELKLDKDFVVENVLNKLEYIEVITDNMFTLD